MRNIPRLVILTALFTAARFTLVSSAVFSEANVASADTVDDAQPNLSGEEAKKHLREQGPEAMKVARYSIYPTTNAPLPNIKEAFDSSVSSSKSADDTAACPSKTISRSALTT